MTLQEEPPLKKLLVLPEISKKMPQVIERSSLMLNLL